MGILQKTSDITVQILEALEKTQKEILFQIYYVDDDVIFGKYAKILIEKAMQGIPVYCLFDALGSYTLPGSVIESKLLKAGVNIQYFNWLTPWAGNNKKLLYFRNHKRSLIIDKNVVYAGGWCIGEKTENWIESYIESYNEEVIDSALRDFWTMYIYARKTQLRFKKQKRYSFSPYEEISYTYQAPIFNGRYIYYTHRKLIHSAKRRIILVTPYFSPVYKFKKSIYEAKEKGLQVEIYIPKKTNWTIVDIIARTYISTMLKVGVSLYLSNKMIHAKVGLFDDTLYIGSLNLDAISLRYNFENGMYTKNLKDIKDFENDIEELKKDCHLVTIEEWNKRSRFEKIFDFIMKIFRGLV